MDWCGLVERVQAFLGAVLKVMDSKKEKGERIKKKKALEEDAAKC